MSGYLPDNYGDLMFGKVKQTTRPQAEQLKQLMGKSKGKATLERGDQLGWNGAWHIVIAVAAASAIIANADKKTTRIPRTVNDYFLKKPRYSVEQRSVLIDRYPELFALADNPVDKDETEITAEAQSPGSQPVPTNQGETESEDGMKTRNNTAPATSRRRARKPAEPTDVSVGRTSGELGALFGHSVCAVMMAAGKAGATFEQATEVLKKHKLKAADSTVKQNLRIGKKRDTVVELTKEQLQEFGVK